MSFVRGGLAVGIHPWSLNGVTVEHDAGTTVRICTGGWRNGVRAGTYAVVMRSINAQ